MHFVEWDFFKELPFLDEKDPELLKQAGWLLRRAREINKAISDRNNYIQAAINLTASQRGGLNYYQLNGILQRQVRISNAECVTTLEFFSMLLDTAKRLEAISRTYKIPGAQTKLIGPSLKPIRFFDGRHWEDAQHRLIAEGGHVTPAGLNGAVTLQRILEQG
jgi:hypothetical protein